MIGLSPHLVAENVFLFAILKQMHCMDCQNDKLFKNAFLQNN